MVQSDSGSICSNREYLDKPGASRWHMYLFGRYVEPIQQGVETPIESDVQKWIRLDNAYRAFWSNWTPEPLFISPVPNVFRGWGWWESVKDEVYETMTRLEQDTADQTHKLGRSIHSVLRNHKASIATGLIVGRVPTTSATGETKSAPPVVRTRNPIFEFKTPYDYVLLGFMAVYLGVALYLRARTAFYDTGFRASYALTISLGALAFIVNRDEFATPIRTTVLEIWFPAAIHVAVQYCYDNYNPTRHILCFLGLFTIVALALYQFPTISLLEILPPYVAVIALIAMAIYEVRKIFQPGRRTVVSDEEHANQAIVLEDRATNEQRRNSPSTSPQ